MLTNPVSSHALARAAHAIGIHETSKTVIDQLEADKAETGTQTSEGSK
jgi:multisubunit Na+/H+ antiporter MnhG subunit